MLSIINHFKKPLTPSNSIVRIDCKHLSIFNSEILKLNTIQINILLCSNFIDTQILHNRMILEFGYKHSFVWSQK